MTAWLAQCNTAVICLRGEMESRNKEPHSRAAIKSRDEKPRWKAGTKSRDQEPQPRAAIKSRDHRASQQVIGREVYQ